MRKLSVSSFVFVLAVFAFYAVASVPVARARAQEKRPAVEKPAAPEVAPPLTDLERARLELVQTRTDLARTQAALFQCRGEIGNAQEEIGSLRANLASQTLTAEEARLKREIEAARPGWTWDPKTGAFAKKKEG